MHSNPLHPKSLISLVSLVIAFLLCTVRCGGVEGVADVDGCGYDADMVGGGNNGGPGLMRGVRTGGFAAYTFAESGQALKKRIVQWDDEFGCPRHIGIAVGIDGKPSTAAGGVIAFLADIEFGVDGAVQHAVVDVRNGETLSVYGSHVVVSAIDDSDVGAILTTAPVTVYAGLSLLGAGGMADASSPSRTFRSATSPTGQYAAVIPNFAKTVDVQRRDRTIGYTIQFLDNSGVLIMSEFYIPAGADVASPIQIPNGASQVRVIEDAPLTRVYIIFNLSL